MLRFFSLLTLIVQFGSFVIAQTPQNNDLAVLKYKLSEFKDASNIMGRSSLTRFSPDGKYLAISGKSADIIIYDTATGEIKTKIDGSKFEAFSFSPDSKYVITQNTAEKGILIHETETGKKVREIKGLGGISFVNKSFGGAGLINTFGGVSQGMVLEMGEVPMSPDWKTILVNKNDKEFELIDFESGQKKAELDHARYSKSWEMTKLIFVMMGAMGGNPLGFMLLGSASNTQFSPDGKYLVITNGNKNPTLWEVETGKLLNKFESQQRIFFAQFSPDSKFLATSDFTGNTKVFDVASGREISAFGGKKDLTLVADWSRDSQKVYSINPRKGEIRAFEPNSGKLLFNFEKSASSAFISSHNGEYVVTVPRKDKKTYFQIWEMQTGKLLASIPRPAKKYAVTSIKWSPDDKMLVTSSGFKNEVELWNLKGELLQNFKNATFPMQFSPDGKMLLTGGKLSEVQKEDDIGYLWEVKPQTANN
jgi:WD40 repeat protein